MMASSTLMWFSCCVTGRPRAGSKRPRRPPIDRSMIGLPTDFRHTGHIGTSDVAITNTHLSSIQTQMATKGGYDNVSPVEINFKLNDVQRT